MKHRILFVAILALALCPMLLHAESRLQYGFKFGVSVNSFDEIPNSPNNPFETADVNGQLGYIAGVFYDYQLMKGNSGLYLTFGGAWKMLSMKGNFATDDDPPITGDYKNYFHLVDIPIGLKYVFKQYNGRPFAGAGFQMDVIAADQQTFGVDGHDELQDDPPWDTTPIYASRVNTGVYFHGGFELPSKKYLYVFEVKYIRWTRDNFTPAESWFERGQGEFQFTFGVKIR
jgi:hypothetical protein